MGPGNWRTGLDIERLLTEKPEQFDFFQAVKIIEQLRRRLGVAESEETSTHQQVKFSSVVSQAFPTTNITEINLSEGANEPAEMRVNFMGLAGAHGPLPQPLSQVIIDETRSKNAGAAAFLDIFNNRLVQLFYESKSRVSASLATVVGERHPLGQNILATAGLSGIDVEKKLGMPNLALLRFSGLLANRPLPRPAVEKLITGLFNIPTKINEFIGRWLKIDEQLQTKIGKNGRNNRLGLSTVVGGRVWDQGGGIEVELGPLSNSQFESFLNDGKNFEPLKELLNFSVDQSLTIRLRLIAAQGTREKAFLSRKGSTRLGWSSWLLTNDEMPEDRQVTILLRN